MSICCFATRYKTPAVCRYVATQLDIKHLRVCRYVRRWRTRYLLALRAIDICSLCSHSICCLQQQESIAPFFLHAPHIDVESSLQYHDRLNVDMLLRNSISIPSVCRYVAVQLDIKHLRCVDMLLCNSIFARIASNRYISHCVRNSICCRWQRVSIAPLVVTYLALPVGQRISSALAPYRAEGYIERRVSGAYRR